MTCANWGLTILSVAIFVFSVWPNLIGQTVSTWVVAIAAVLILITSWTAMVCKCNLKKKK